MERALIVDKIISIASDTFLMEPQSISPSFSNQDSEAWDSLGHLRLFMAIEEEFSHKFDVNDITAANTIEDIVQLVEKNCA